MNLFVIEPCPTRTQSCTNQSKYLHYTEATLTAHAWRQREFRAHLTAIDEAVIVCECNIHHRPGLYFTVDDHRALLDAVHAENGRLRGVNDGSGQQGAVDAAIADGECAARHLIDAEGAVLCLLTKGYDRLNAWTAWSTTYLTRDILLIGFSTQLCHVLRYLYLYFSLCSLRQGKLRQQQRHVRP